MSGLRVLIVLLGVACASRNAPSAQVPAARPLAAADCLQAHPLGEPIETAPPPTATVIAPGRFLYIEPWPPGEPGESREGAMFTGPAQAWVGVETAEGISRFWPLAEVQNSELDNGTVEVIEEVDLTGDGITEIVLDVRLDATTPDDAPSETSRTTQTQRHIWDPANARTLARFTTRWHYEMLPPEQCDEWCMGDILASEAVEAGFDCRFCDEQPNDDVQQDVDFDGTTVVVHPSVMRVGTRGLPEPMAQCPEGRFTWTEQGFAIISPRE
ncbi:MAG: hypothetical protein AAGA48_37455 [Myxococcota bacterium]